MLLKIKNYNTVKLHVLILARTLLLLSLLDSALYYCCLQTRLLMTFTTICVAKITITSTGTNTAITTYYC